MIERTLTALVLLCASAVSFADYRTTEIIVLHHRLVDDVIPTLRQLVAPGGTVTGMNNQLIIRTTADNHADLKQVLAALDTRLRQLRISVRQDIEADTQFREDALSARIELGDVAAGVTQASGGPGAHVNIGDGENRVGYDGLSTRRRDDREHLHFVSTIEGRPAFINTGQSVPVAERDMRHTPYGTRVRDSIQYRDVGSGFYVTPRVVGENGVNLEISSYAESLAARDGDVIDTRGLSTMVTGRLGEWIALGGGGQASADRTSGVLYRSRQSEREVYDVWVKVEVVP